MRFKDETNFKSNITS